MDLFNAARARSWLKRGNAASSDYHGGWSLRAMSEPRGDRTQAGAAGLRPLRPPDCRRDIVRGASRSGYAGGGASPPMISSARARPRRLLARHGFELWARADCAVSSEPLREDLELDRNLKYIRVRSFILSGAPFAYKTTNIAVLGLFSGNGGLEDVLAANDPDGLVVDLDRVDD